METSSSSHLFLLEEIENHLSFSNLNALIRDISERRRDRQLIVTTHSSFVMNKLGIESVLLFMNGKCTTLNALPPNTQDYFLKLPGYDTLRLILSRRAILVEGPSDELIVQKAFLMRFGRLPLEMGIDVISVGSLAFKRFLEIAEILKTVVDVVTDNDGDREQLKKKYDRYLNHDYIRILFDVDTTAPTLESQLLRSNGRDMMNNILGKQYKTDAELLSYMKNNKTECALQFFEAKVAWTVPGYIANAVYQ
jgi:predicted ATP-dependent endonuclease of OLD family